MRQRLNRREWMAASGLATMAACTRNKGAGYPGYALVANAGDNSLSVVDLTSFRLSASVALGEKPSRVLAGPTVPSTTQAFVLTPGNGTVHSVEGEWKRSRSQKLADFVGDLAISADGKSLWAVAPHSRELIQVDATTFRAGARRKLSAVPDAVDYSSNGYAATVSRAGSVELINLVTGQHARAETPGLSAIRFRADGKLLFGANVSNHSLLVLDVPSLQTVAELPLAMQPDNLCFNADQGQLFVTGAGMDGVAVVFPYNTLVVDQTLLAGRSPGAMACSETPAYLFVGSSSGSDVCILNIDTRKVVGFVETGGKPSFIKITPDSQYALVFDEVSGAMSVIHITWIRENGPALRAKTTAALFTMLNVGSRPVDAVVISQRS